MKGTRGKRTARVAAAVGIITGVLVAGVGPVGAAPTLAVTPATGLRDLQHVQVDGTGFAPGSPVITVQCQVGNTTPKGCDGSTVAFGTADPDGAAHFTATVRRRITIGRRALDCAPGPCELRASAFPGGDTINVPIAFDPAVPPVIPGLAVTPSTPLVDHQLVTVRGTGFNPRATALVIECAAKKARRRSGACTYGSERSALIADNGSFRIRNFAVARVLATENGDLDCAAKPGACVVMVDTEDVGGPTTLEPLTFDPGVPAVTSHASATPTNGLVDHERVTVSGRGFLPGATVQVIQCSTGGPEDVFGCDFGNPSSVTAGFRGQFHLDVYVHRTISAFTGVTTEGTLDCAARPHACALQVLDNSDSVPADVPLTFDPAAPAKAPTIRANPATGLVDDQRITASATGFAPYSTVTLVECSEDALSGDLSACDQATSGPAIVGGDGRVTGSIAVHRTIGGYEGLEDCAKHAGACVVAAVAGGLGITGGDGLSILPIGPLGPLGPLGSFSTGSDGPAAPPPVRRAANGQTLPGVAFAPLSFG